MAKAPLPEKPIALVGLMGAGKSTVGRRLARRLALPFVDADAEIEAAAGMSVAGIFERRGEAHFRERERQVIAGLVDGPPKVIATGGGAFVDPGTRTLLLERCTVVWLDAEPEVLADRVGGNERPLLTNGSPETLLGMLAEARRPAYAEAHLTVPNGGSPDAAVERIVAALGSL